MKYAVRTGRHTQNSVVGLTRFPTATNLFSCGIRFAVVVHNPLGSHLGFPINPRPNPMR